jgi:hypothetical protein
MTFDLTQSTLALADAELFLSIRKVFQKGISLEEVTALRPDMTMLQACAFLDRLSAAGIVEWKPTGCYADVISAGHSLAASGLKPRIDKDAAHSALRKAIAKARGWNRDKSNPVVISELRLFGSFLGDHSDYGDLDIEVVCAERPMGEAKWAAQVAALPASVRNNFYVHRNPKAAVVYRFAKKAVQMIDRASPAVAAVGKGTIEAIGADWRQVYAFDPKAGTELAPDETYHPRSHPRLEPEAPKYVPVTTFLDLLPEVKQPDLQGVVTSSYIASHAEKYWWGQMTEDRVRARPDMRRETLIRGVTATKWVDAVEALDITSNDPFEALREIQQWGVNAGHLAAHTIWFECHTGGMTCEFEMSLIGEDDEELARWMIFEIEVESNGKRNVTLTPKIRTECRSFEECEEDAISSDVDHIAMARSLAQPMIEIYTALGVTSGANISLSFAWNPENPAPTLPKLGGLIRQVAENARTIQVKREQLPALKDLLEGAMDWYASLRFERHVDVELRSAFQTFREDDLEPGGESIKISNKSTAEALFPAKEFDLCPVDDEGALENKARSFIPRLNGLGDSWILTVERQVKKHAFPDNLDLQTIEAALIGEKVSIL